MADLWQTVPLGHFGVEVLDFDLPSLAETRTGAALRALLAEQQLLLFRRMTITPAAQSHFTRIFGSSEPGLARRPAAHKLAGNDEMLRLSNAQGSPTSDYGFGWHSDGLAYARVPHGVTVLQCQACPPGSGATLFADQYRAYDRLEQPLQHRIADLCWRLPPIAFSEVPSGRSLVHPMVRSHPVNGRRFLFCAPAARQICGWSRQDSEDLLQIIRANQIAADCLYRHEWKPGDLLVWENCALLHTRRDVVDPVSQGPRLMLRTATCGDFAAVECASAPSE